MKLKKLIPHITIIAALAVFALASAVRLIAADWREDERERK